MSWFFVGVGALLLGAVTRLTLPLRAGRTTWLGLVFTGTGVASWPALRVIAGHPPLESRFATALPGGAWLLRLDPLAAWFVPILLGVGACAAAFGVGYFADTPASRRVAMTDAMMTLLLAAMALVVTAQAVVPFLVAWEVMAISGLLLILHDGERPAVRHSGFVYLVATHLATLSLLAMFALWGNGATDLTFPSLHAAFQVRPEWALVLLPLGLAGFGLKAGMVPLHFWLPGAHAESPSHVSAVLSGVMIKTGIYGLLRLTLLCQPVPAWWGWSLLGAGLLSGVFGVLWALAQHDLKRLLAYHSVENIGIILIGLGAGAIGVSHHQPLLAVLGVAGALLHTLNHALFKSLLFLGSGAIARATGTRHIGDLGGLARRMPWTWGTFLIASLAIVGLPPLNGFVSEWAVALALLAGLGGPTSLRALSLGLAGLGLIGALALACFTKVDGAMFLGQPRSQGARSARDVTGWLRFPPLILSLVCVTLGVAPALSLGPALHVAASLVMVDGPQPPLDLEEVVAGAQHVGWLAIALIVLVVVLAALRHLLLRGRPVTAADTWACGFPQTTPRMQYTAASFAAPLLATFGALSGVVIERTARTFRVDSVDILLDRAGRPLWRRLQHTAAQLRWMQGGRLHWYLIYVLVTLALLLVYLAAREIQ